ncbi:MAG: potassium transporter TrkG, partial [Erysipelotrichaceae bacterium]
ENLYIFKRSIGKDIVMRAVMIVMMNFILLTTGIFLLVITEDFAFIDILFEAASALGTVGLSAGITPSLSSAGKIIIIMLMYLGRIGVITLVLSIIRNRMNASMNKVVYPSENVIIG